MKIFVLITNTVGRRYDQSCIATGNMDIGKEVMCSIFFAKMCTRSYYRNVLDPRVVQKHKHVFFPLESLDGDDDTPKSLAYLIAWLIVVPDYHEEADKFHHCDRSSCEERKKRAHFLVYDLSECKEALGEWNNVSSDHGQNLFCSFLYQYMLITFKRTTSILTLKKILCCMRLNNFDTKNTTRSWRTLSDCCKRLIIGNVQKRV